MLTIDDYWLTFLVATVLPALVALVTKSAHSATVKGVVLAALSAISGTLFTIQASAGVFDPKTAVTSTFITFVTAVCVHFGLLKPAGVTGSSSALQKFPRARHRADV